jgi:hypothetical protein
VGDATGDQLRFASRRFSCTFRVGQFAIRSLSPSSLARACCEQLAESSARLVERRLSHLDTLDELLLAEQCEQRRVMANVTLEIPLTAAGGTEAEAKETFTLHVGPPLTSAEFVRGIAAASPISVEQKLLGFGSAFSARWWVADADADFDDEAGKTQLRIEAGVHSTGGFYVALHQLAFQATILATEAHQ